MEARLLHYFPTLMDVIGASCLRVALTANLISIVLFSDEAGPNFLVSLDALGKYFYLFARSFEEVSNKIFLAQDSDCDKDALQDRSLKFAVTGDIIDDDAVLALVECSPQ
jgi:hypothetical protein